jgi:hypothetical protein
VKDPEFEQEVRRAANAIIDSRAPKPPSGLVTVDALTIHRKPAPPNTFLISEVLAHGLTLLCGRPKVGKSWLSLDVALAVARGGRLMDRFDVLQPGGVLYLGLEESERRTGLRLRKLVPEEQPYMRRIDFVYRLPPLLAGGAAELDKALAARRYELVVIDTLLAAVQQSSGRDVMRSDYAEVDVLRQLAAKHATSILLVHHLRKSGAEYAPDAVAGTSGVTAACDAMWILKRQGPGECVLEVLGREVEEQVFGLRLHTAEPFGWRLTGAGAEVRTRSDCQEIIELLAEEGPMSPKAIADSLRKNRVTIRRRLQDMLKSRSLVRNGNGCYQAAAAPESAGGGTGEQEELGL